MPIMIMVSGPGPEHSQRASRASAAGCSPIATTAFPALILIMMACLFAGWFVLFAGEYAQLAKHIAGGAGFVSNFILLNEVGYFDTEASTKPLLHLWSLGIEEQFYLIWPTLLWIGWRLNVNLLLLVVLLFVGSFGIFYLSTAVSRTKISANVSAELSASADLGIANMVRLSTGAKSLEIEPFRSSTSGYDRTHSLEPRFEPYFGHSHTLVLIATIGMASSW